MSDPDSNADQIRNKRLAKLGSQASPSQQSQPQPQDGEASERSEGSSAAAQPKQTSPSSTPQTNPRPQINITSAPTSGSSPQSQTRPSMNPRPAINISPARSADRTTSPQNGPSSAAGMSRPTSRTGESTEAFEEKTLSAIFKITLKEDQQRDIHGQKLVYLPSLKGELEESGQPVRIAVDVLDQALLEAGSNSGKESPLEYLLPCWKRVARLHKGFKRPSNDDPKYAIVKEARRLCLSYCIFAATMPEMFGLDSPRSSPLKRHLLLDPEDDYGICHDFLAESVKRMEEDDSIATGIVGAVEEMSRDLSKMNMRDDYKPYMRVIRNLVRFPALATAIGNSPMFNQGKDASTYEVSTLLGPYFRLSPLQSEITKEYFSSPKTRDQNFILSSQRALRMTQQMQSSDLLDIVNHLIRASKETREKVLDWFATAININHKRRAMQVDHRLVSSDGFMFNITTCLDQLCEPFMDASFSKIDRIDIDYLRRNPRVDIKEETKLNADQHASDEFYSETVDGTSNFITELFFLTVAAHHYGSESLTTKLSQLDKDLRHMESQIDKLELERPKWASNPMQLRTFEEALKKYKDKYDLGLSYKYTLQGVLLDDLFQARSMQFMRYVIVWLLRLVSGRNFPTEKFSLPLLKEQPDYFKCLPEYFLEDIVSTFKFIMWHMPHVITSTQGDELVMLCISFLQSSEYIKNPYLKAGLVTILFRGTWPRRNGSRGVLADLLNSMPFATEYLLHSLMKFYIEVEFTGTHTQFFDKFNIRFEIFQIVRCIWTNPIYREKLDDEAQKNLDFFVRFVNLLLNDVTFVLDESFSAFITIHDTQRELDQSGASMEESVRQEKEEQLASAQGRAKSYMQLTNETVSMLKLFTEALAESFTMPEIVQRLADMLDYNLDAMVGPKSANLKVDNLAEYGFNPKALLSEIVDVYLNLMTKENFIFAVARDGRSYKPVNFEKAAEILKKWALKSQTDLAKWERLQKLFKAAKEVDDQAEEDLGEIPDEFLDPLMYTFMEDPVILPSSRVTMDRATIRSHLLSDPNDPFNRSPLAIEDVIADTEMKSKIEAFKAEKKSAARVPITELVDDSMDTSAG